MLPTSKIGPHERTRPIAAGDHLSGDPHLAAETRAGKESRSTAGKIKEPRLRRRENGARPADEAPLRSAPSVGQRYLALLLLILTVVFWGFSFISTKVILAFMPPVSIAFFRQIISVAALLPLVLGSLIRGRFAQLSGVTWLDACLVAASGFFGIVLYFVFENNGIRLSTAANASMIVAAVPVFTLFSEAVFFKLRITARLLICLALSIAGVYLVISGDGRLDLSSARTLGNLLVVGAMICWVAYTIINKKLTHKYSSLLLTYFQTLFSTVLFLPFILPELKDWRALPAVPLLHLIYLGVCCSALGYIFYVYAVKRLGATVSSSFLNLVPVVTAAGSWFLFGERATGTQFLGMGLVMGSLYVLILPAGRLPRPFAPRGRPRFRPREFGG